MNVTPPAVQQLDLLSDFACNLELHEVLPPFFPDAVPEASLGDRDPVLLWMI